MNEHFLGECEKIEEQSKRGYCRKVFRTIKRLSGMTTARMPVIKDKTRKVLIEGDQVKEWWTEYMQELYHCDPSMRDVYISHPFFPEPQVTKEEVRSALESLAKGKALGIDDIPIEPLKSVGESAIDVMAILCQKIWATTEWPQDWKWSVYLPLPKKGDSRKCSNNMTIALLATGSKVLLQILQQRFFQKDRGTTDPIANLRWLMEVSREYQKNVYLCFIDYSKAFDCIDHNRLWFSLRSMGIMEHLIVLMRNLYEGQEATVHTSHGDTEWFGISKGVQQGCILSAYLFNLYAEKIMCKAELDEDGLGVTVDGLRLTNL